ncbi:unnamed protein product [Auanema sp. JU1783]|nr:unnamed protein product [Auanema sp. JU1783]
MKKIFFLLHAVAICTIGYAEDPPAPVVIWHGMGDSCCNPLSMGRIKKMIEAEVDGVYVKSLMFGGNVFTDTEYGFFSDVNNLVKSACDQIAADPYLQDGYNAIGFSQGAQFLRAVAQRCPEPPMLNFVSVGGQHQGIFGVPYCSSDVMLCMMMSKLLDYGAYTTFVQKRSVQAQYWHDPYNEELYVNKSLFLADINNEKNYFKGIYKDDIKKKMYRKNLLKLKNMLLIKFTKDKMIIPKESSWFQYFAPGTKDIQPLNETKLYKDDMIGLKKLVESGKVKFLEIEGDHLQITNEEFKEHVIEPYLRNKLEF